MKALVYSRLAQQDLSDILEGIAADKPGAASAFVERLEQAAKLLAQFSDIGTSRDDLLPGLRVFSYRGYGLYFRQDDSRVTVERVLAPGIDLTSELFD